MKKLAALPIIGIPVLIVWGIFRMIDTLFLNHYAKKLDKMIEFELSEDKKKVIINNPDFIEFSQDGLVVAYSRPGVIQTMVFKYKYGNPLDFEELLFTVKKNLALKYRENVLGKKGEVIN